MCDRIEVFQSRCVTKDDIAKALSLELSVFDDARKAGFDLREQIGIRFKQLMVDRIAVEHKRAALGERI